MSRNLTQSPRTEGKLREKAQQNSKGDTNETVKSDPSSHSLTTAHHWRFHINKPEKAQPPSCQSFFRYPTKQWDPPFPIHMHQWTAPLDLWLITKEKKILVNILHETSADNIMTQMMMTIRRTGRPFQPRVRSDIMSSWQSPQKMDKELCIAALTMYQSSQATAFVPEALTATMYKAPAWCVLSLTIKR